jgi:hypothetical protein
MVGLLLSSSSLLPKFVILAQVIESVNVLLRYVCDILRANSTLTGVNEVVEHGSGQEEGNIHVDKLNRSCSMDGSFCV